MKDFGASASWTSDQNIQVDPQPYHCLPFTVESDWSAASYWYQIAALSPQADIELTGLFRHSYQGDSRGAEVFARLGVATEYTETGIRLKKNGTCVERLDEDFVDIPDLAQTFVVTCALLNVPFRFTGLQSLRIKETDRIEALKTEMKKLGYILHDKTTVSFPGTVNAWNNRHVPLSRLTRIIAWLWLLLRQQFIIRQYK